MEIAIVFCLTILTIIFPVLSLPINIICIFFLKKYKKAISLLLALSLAAIAYTWVPAETMDLYRFQLEMSKFQFMDFAQILEYIKINFEPLSYITKYLVARTGDLNLLQFIISFVGYYEILWLMCDYTKRNNIKNSAFIITFLFVIISLRYIDFISGLWFNFAIINFAVGIYLEKIRKTKFIHYIFYAITIMLHTSTIYLILLYIFTRFLRFTKKVNAKNIMIVFLIFLLIGPLITLLNTYINLNIIQDIYNSYISYFLNGNQFSDLHDGWTLYLGIARLFISMLILYISMKEKIFEEKEIKEIEYRNYIIYLAVSVLAILFQAHVFTRYIFLVQLLLVPFILKMFSTKLTKNKFIPLVLMIVISLLMTFRGYAQIKGADLIPCVKNNITSNIFELKNGIY